MIYLSECIISYDSGYLVLNIWFLHTSLFRSGTFGMEAVARQFATDQHGKNPSSKVFNSWVTHNCCYDTFHLYTFDVCNQCTDNLCCISPFYKTVMVIRNGWFSFRWTEIFDIGGPGKSICSSHTVLKAQPVEPEDPNCPHMQYAPYPIDDVV